MTKVLLITLTFLMFNEIIAQTQIDTTNIHIFHFSGIKYEVIKEGYSWKDAARIADERGGILAEINSQEEQDTIFFHLNNAEIDITKTISSDGGGASYIWIGGNDIKDEGLWIWDGNNDGFGKQFWEGDRNGSAIDGLYSNWGNEPDNFSNQDALGLAITNWPLGVAGQWNDVHESNQMYFVIEYDNSTFKVKNTNYLPKENLLNINVKFMFDYDSVQVMVDSTVLETFLNVTEQDSVFDSYFKPTKTGFVDIYMRAYKDALILYSNIVTFKVYSFDNPIISYSTDFEDLPIDDFLLENFEIIRGAGFRDKAIHTSHNYENNSEAIITLKTPIVVDPIKSQILYSDVAIVEPGDSGSSFGEEEFNDYVIVEGSNKVEEWIHLLPGYDARTFPDWEMAWETPTLYRNLFKQHSIELTDSFSPGDTILLRFRLYSNDSTNGWGWVIDSLQIQEFPLTDIKEDYTISQFRLKQNYPNPFNPSTTIKYQIPVGNKNFRSPKNVTLKIYDILGREVATLVNQHQKAGSYEVQFNVSETRKMTSGVYFYQLKSGSFIDTKKLLLLK